MGKPSTPPPWEATDDGDIMAFVPEYNCRMSLKLMAAAPTMAEILRKVAKKIPNTEGGDMVPGCAICQHDPQWPENYPTHRPDCELAALLKRIEDE